MQTIRIFKTSATISQHVHPRLALPNPAFRLMSHPNQMHLPHIRSFSKHAPRLYPNKPSATPAPSSLADPSRPDLYYHLLDPPNPISQSLPAFALSFLPEPPPSPSSQTIIGWLPAQTKAQTRTNENDSHQAGLNDFWENPGFREILHQAIQAGLREEADDVQVNAAIQTQQGWMHIHDDRNIPPLGRIGDPDDIIASVLVQDSKILPETYQPMPAYRLCTSDGITQLTPGLAHKLKLVLAQRAKLEAES